MHLCKVLFGDPPRPLNAELQRPAGVCYIGALDQHPLDQQTVLRRVPEVGLAVTVTVYALKKTNNKHGLNVSRISRSVNFPVEPSEHIYQYQPCGKGAFIKH